MDYELPPLLSDSGSEGSLSSGEAAGRAGSNRAPMLIAGSSAESRAQTPPHSRVQRPAQPPLPPPAHNWQGGLDDIDHSHDEFLDDYFAEEDDGADQLFGPRGLLAGVLQQQEYMQDPLNEGLLQQIPVQNLLEALLNSGQGGLLAGAGGPFAMPGMGYGGPDGSRFTWSGGHTRLAGVESRIPAGLDASARQHAISMAEQGFVTAMDPTRHAACAAEGIPGGRRLMSPRGATPGGPPAPGQRQHQPVAAGAAGTARQAGSLGGLQRADSAVLGGGLQRGDSAASQGMSRVTHHAGRQHSAPTAAAGSEAAGAGGRMPAQSRLASTARTGASAGQHVADAPEGLVRSGGESDPMPELNSASSDSDYEYDPLVLRPQQQRATVGARSISAETPASHGSVTARSSAGSNAQEPDSYAEPPRRRQRRNAVYGQLPGLGRPAMDSTGVAAGLRGRRQRPWDMFGVPPLFEGIESDSDSENGSERGSAGLVRQVRRQQRHARQQQRRGSGGGAAGSASGGSNGFPPALESASNADQLQQQEQHSGIQLSSSEHGGIPGPLRDAASSSYTTESEAEPLRVQQQGLSARAAQAAPASQSRQIASQDQQVVMQALSALLPAQQDAAGWAELAAYVRHASNAGRRAGSGGGVQLLSRLVAAAASRFPAEAEAAGLTERPLAPPPSMAHSAAHSAAATAAVSPVGTPAHSVPAAAAAAAATVAAAAAAERQRADQESSEQQRIRQQRAGQRVAEQRVVRLAATEQPVAEQGLQLPLVTFVAETPAAAAALQHELGSAVRVVADGQEAQGGAAVETEQGQQQREGMPVLVSVVVPGRDLPIELQLSQPPLGVMLATEDDYEAAFEEQEPHLERQLRYLEAHLQPQQQAQQQASPAAANAAGLGTSGQPDNLDAAQTAQAAITSTYTSLVAHTAAMRGQHRFAIANTEVMLRVLVASGAATQPLPPLVAAAVAAAAPPRPQQAEE